MSVENCVSCECQCVNEEEIVEATQAHEEGNDTEFAVLLALVPAMTMTLFNMMGLL